MMAAGKMQRLSLLCGLLLAALAVCGLQRSFLAIDARSNPRSQTPVMQQGQQGLPQMPRAASTEWTSWAATGVLAAGAAALALKSQHRDESSATMFSKHDKRTFRGKLHAHTFGKYRLRKNKARRIQAIKNGTFDPEKVVQRGQPEPEHPWDLDNIVENPIYYAPDYFKEVLYDYWDDVNAKMREKWQDYMGIKGNQRYFKNWTPPGMEPPPPEPEPTPPPPAPKKPKSDPPEEKPKAAPKAEEKKPEPKPEPKEEEAPPPKAEEKKPEPKPEPKEEKAPPPKAEEKKPEPKPEPKEEKAPPPKAEEKKPEPKPEPKEEKAPPPKAEEKKPEPKPEPKEEKAPPPKAEEKKPEPKPEPKEDKAPPPKAEEKKPEAKSGAAPSAKDVKTLRERSKAGILDCKKALSETDGDMEKAMEWLKKKGMAKADKKAGNVTVEGCVASYVHFNNKIAVLVEVNSETDFVAQNAIFKEFAGDVAMQVAANDDVTVMTVDDVPEDVREKVKKQEMEKEDLAGKPDAIKEKIVAGRLNKKFEEKALMNQKWLKDDNITVQEAVKQIIAKLGENIVVRRFERLTLGEGLEKKDQDFAAGVEKELAKYKTEGEAKEEPKEEPKAEKKEEKEEKKEEKKAVQVSAAQVKELRGRSGAGILDAKKALAECDCDMDKAMEWLKKKGMAKADKKAGNLSVEGVIASYVHFNSKLGVLVEVNSETDFVALNDIFKEFAADVAMQVAAQPDVKFVSVDEVPADVKEKEKALEMGKEDLAGKPDNIKEKIVEGRLKKKFEETALLGQKWLKDEDKTVQEVLKEKIAKLGENIVIRRFQRLTLGEGLDKKDDDFAAGVEKELAKYRQ